MRKIFVLCIIVLCGGCATMNNGGSRDDGSDARSDDKIVTRTPGLVESLVTLPVAIIGGVAKALVGETRVETPEQYKARRQAEIEANANAVNYNQPYYAGAPFYPGYRYMRFYYTPGYVWFITSDGSHHRHVWNGRDRWR